jgi:lipid A disaccharide synthetase
MGESSILTRDKIIELMSLSNISVDDILVDAFIEQVCSVTFIGREVRQSEFEYEYDFENSDKIVAMANKFNSQRFKIHNAFIPYLECKDYIK